MSRKEARDRAESTVRAAAAETERVVTLATVSGRRALQRLYRILRQSDRELDERIRVWHNLRGDDLAQRFSEADAIAYRAQTNMAINRVRLALQNITTESAQAHIEQGVQSTIRTLESLEESFVGISRPLRVAQAAEVAGIVDVTSRSLLRRYATSANRYGVAMIGRMESTIATGLTSGLSRRDMVASLVGKYPGPRHNVSMASIVENGVVKVTRVAEIPEGLFVRHKYWAERIVRTETANSYNAAKANTLVRAQADDFPDLKKKIVAHFDARTAYDSVYVHGQVQPPNGDFHDGAGRVYQHPPARPNDRETVIPWRDDWPELQSTRPKSESFVKERYEAMTPKAKGRAVAPAGVTP